MPYKSVSAALETQQTTLHWYICNIVPQVRIYPRWHQILARLNPVTINYMLNTGQLQAFIARADISEARGTALARLTRGM